MTAEAWQAANSHYLSASLAWLRLRLQKLAQPEAMLTIAPPAEIVVLTEVPAGAPAQSTVLRRLFGGQAAGNHTNSTEAPLPLLLEEHGMSLEEQISQAQAERLAIAAQMQPAPALVLLGQQLGLSSFEQDILLLCAAPELDMRVASLCAQAQGDPSRAYPTFALALALFDEPVWDALSPDRPLRYWRLIEISQPGGTPLTASPLRADERMVSYLKGLNRLDDRLSTVLVGVPPGDVTALAPSQLDVMNEVLWHWQHTPVSAGLPVAQLLGTDPASKLLVAQALAAVLNRDLYRVGVDRLAAQAADLETLVRLWQREGRLLPLLLYVDAQSADGAAPDAYAALDRFLGRTADIGGAILLGVRDALPRINCAAFAVDVAKPSAPEQKSTWIDALHQLAQASNATWDEAAVEMTAGRLAAQFSLNMPEIYTLASSVMTAGGAPGARASRSADRPLDERLWEVCRATTRPQLDTLAQRLEPKATWDDLVVPEESARLLRQIAVQVRQRSKVYDDWGFAAKMNRGLGISALFAGESGTGKTMAAEVIANDLQLNLYRIDLSAVVNKYIGETEKNLRRLFDAAEDGGAILFFDEADALFGKRSEVKDSHDRYANIEINYLLQRIEAYRGLAILATNMKSALDPAFMRRLRFIVTFAFPGIAERKLMWQKVFPPQTPTDALDYDRLARLNVTGGNIHSIALSAAFTAAQANDAVNMPIVLAAARTEMRKLEKPINEADFRA